MPTYEKVHLDLESRSPVPFGRQTNALTTYQYSRDPRTEILLASYKIGTGKIGRWRRDQPLPKDLVEAVGDGLVVCAHNAGFEWAMWNNILVPRFGAPVLPFEQMDCTAVRAAVMALPRSLGEACKAIGLEIRKDEEGAKLMMKMAKPRKARKDEDPDSLWWWETPEQMNRLHDYCDIDVEVEYELDQILEPLSQDEWELWQMDHRTNQRGVLLDIPFVKKAKKVLACVERRYDEELQAITDGEVTTVTKVADIRGWVNDRGMALASLDKVTVENALKDDDIDPDVRRVLEIRQEAGKSSVAKFNKYELLAFLDNVMRENILHHGANTGRGAGKGAQLQNLPSRGGLKWYKAEDVIRIIMETDDPEWAIDRIEMIYGYVPEALSSCLRACIIAREGKKMFVADYSNIEGRVAAWLGGEKWKLEAFKLYDTPLLDDAGQKIPDPDTEFKRKGPDLYKVTAAQIMGVSPESVDKVNRNILGKVPELACLSPETKVLTLRGYLDIVEVTLSDYLWDGVEWVKHQGLVYRGEKEVINLEGVRLTEDHLVMCGNSWKEAYELASSRSMMTLAKGTASASLPFSEGGYLDKEAQIATARGSVWSDAPAEECLIKSTPLAWLKVSLPAVITALLREQEPTGKNISVMRTLCPTMTTVEDYSTGYQRLSQDVGTPITSSSRLMADAESKCLRNGKRIKGLFSSMCKPAQAGTTPLWKWTGKMLMGIMSQVTSVLSQRGKTALTKEVSTTSKGLSENRKASSKNWSPVYDILNSGPRNRFTIKTDRGHLIVHNCGFGGGAGAFTGMADTFNIDIGRYWDVIRSSTEQKFVDRALENWSRFGKMSGSPQDSWVAAETVKLAWRARHPGIVRCWADAEDQAVAALKDAEKRYARYEDDLKKGVKDARVAPAKWFKFAGGKCAFGAKKYGTKMFLISRLPNGRRIYRAEASLKQVKKFGRMADEIRFWTVDSVTKKWVRTSTYGGDLFQSYVQGIARDLMKHGMGNVEANGFDPILEVHDEVGAEGDADRDLHEYEDLMADTPEWAAGCPVSALGYVADRYRKD